MENDFDTGPKTRWRRAVDPSLGYWLGPSVTPTDYSHAPIHHQTPIIPRGVPAVDSDLTPERPRISDGDRLIEHPFAYNTKTSYSDDILVGSSSQHPTLASARMTDEERPRTLDRASPLLSPCLEKAPSSPSSPQAALVAPSQRDAVTVEQFLQARSRARKPSKRRTYKKRPKVTTTSDLERLKEADSSFAREEDQLFSDGDADPPALPTKRRRKTRAASDQRAARKRRRTRKPEETDFVQPFALQEGPLPNIATRSLHDRWHPGDPRTGRPFLQPAVASARHRVSLAPLRPAPVLPRPRTDDSPSSSVPNTRDAPPTATVSGNQNARRSTRRVLAMEPTEEHERKLASWKSDHAQDRAARPSRRVLNDVQHGGTPRAAPRVHPLNIASETTPGRAILSNATPSTSDHRPTGAPQAATPCVKFPGVPRSPAAIDQDQGDQSMALVEDSFLDIDEPGRGPRPPLAHLSDILGTLLKTAKEVAHS